MVPQFGASRCGSAPWKLHMAGGSSGTLHSIQEAVRAGKPALVFLRTGVLTRKGPPACRALRVALYTHRLAPSCHDPSCPPHLHTTTGARQAGGQYVVLPDEHMDRQGAGPTTGTPACVKGCCVLRWALMTRPEDSAAVTCLYAPRLRERRHKQLLGQRRTLAYGARSPIDVLT